MEKDYHYNEVSKVKTLKTAYHSCIHTILGVLVLSLYLHYNNILPLPTKKNVSIIEAAQEKENLTMGQLLAR